MADWDENGPADDDIVSQFPASERAARAAVKTNFGVDHHEADDADVGKHEVIQVTDNAADPTIASGQVGIWNNAGALNTRVAGGAVQRIMKGESGTKVVFYQASAPTGWTQDTAVNDRVLKVVSGTGGGTGGSWTISGITTNNHALTVAQMPSHDHSASTGGGGGHNHTGSTSTNGSHRHNTYVHVVDSGSTPRIGSTGTTAGFNEVAGSNSMDPDGNHNHSFTTSTVGNHNHSVSIGNTGGGNGHNHGVSHNGAWRPSHINVIVASLD